MGAINPLSLVSLGIVPGIVSTGVQLASQAGAFGNSQQSGQDLALQQLQEKQALQEKQLAADTALEREKIAANAAASEEQRQAALRRAVARQRARTGASGVSNAGGGSADAVLLGLFEESDDELAKRESLDNLRNSALDLRVSSQKSLNVLQRSQLQRRQDFGRNLTGFNFF